MAAFSSGAIRQERLMQRWLACKLLPVCVIRLTAPSRCCDLPSPSQPRRSQRSPNHSTCGFVGKGDAVVCLASSATVSKRRIASERLTPHSSAQASIADVMTSERRTPLTASRPVAGRPAPGLFPPRLDFGRACCSEIISSDRIDEGRGELRTCSRRRRARCVCWQESKR